MEDEQRAIAEFMSLRRTALRLGLPIAYFRRLTEAGVIPYLDTGNGRLLFFMDDVIEALRKASRGQL